MNEWYTMKLTDAQARYNSDSYKVITYPEKNHTRLTYSSNSQSSGFSTHNTQTSNQHTRSSYELPTKFILRRSMNNVNSKGMGREGKQWKSRLQAW